jgi:hypothetical protein
MNRKEKQMAAKNKDEKTEPKNAAIVLRKMGAREIISDAHEVDTIEEFIEPMKEKETKHLFDVIGRIVRARATKSKFGEGVAFVGEFYARLPNKKLYRAGQFFAPGSMKIDLETAFFGRAEGVDVIEFAYKIEVQKDKKASAQGYAYICTPTVEAEESNAIKALAERAWGSSPKALSAPVTE